MSVANGSFSISASETTITFSEYLYIIRFNIYML